MLILRTFQCIRKASTTFLDRVAKMSKRKVGTVKKGRGSSECHIVEEVYPSEIGYLEPNEVNYVEKSSPCRGVSKIILSYRNSYSSLLATDEWLVWQVCPVSMSIIKPSYNFQGHSLSLLQVQYSKVKSHQDELMNLMNHIFSFDPKIIRDTPAPYMIFLFCDWFRYHVYTVLQSVGSSFNLIPLQEMKFLAWIPTQENIRPGTMGLFSEISSCH